jgi:hypothetical protein
VNPPLSFTQALTQLTLFTSQTSNFTFSTDEITQALQSAWNDTYVCNVVWDSSLSFVSGTWQYPIPATLTTVRGLYFIRTASDSPEPVGSDLYEVVAGNLQFNRQVDRWLSATYTLYIKGLYKLTISDNLTSDNLVNYVINLAAEILLNNLVLKRTFVFLRNDTTLADIVRALQVVQGNVLRYKQAILREFEAS